MWLNVPCEESARFIRAWRRALLARSVQDVSKWAEAGALNGGEVRNDVEFAGGRTGGAFGDLRFISDDQKEKARSKMRAIVARNLPGTKAKITFTDGLPAMTPAEGNYTLLKLLDQASRDLSLGAVEPLDPGDRGAGDIGYISHLLPSLDGIGIGGTENAHAPGEFADLESLPNLIKRSALLIYRLTR